ncbi:hypothetical protein E2C00_02820 [Streptomyces sp. WAC05374]|uniref:pirin-like C-terminal cupin domain-containing protein n=1 Tax=Streptomyces sp. WAC05374 TaxID=2487420 RepID=UPI000F88E2E1|nr:pirin-like C-terminal cupin domain-containing protein [Streptomyces sp. WAC05374]RST19228.1 hypothetical protein EF905_02200 [Streptomyces sp. WAC05374]TDF50440.1 hypothetical protein E2B92_02800 [Streptomyces sp. WAC05374]TDF51807.1 hypothetical protein E2C02_22985 [Streptomyces sp. WAC05374]TDF60693.1 hypothetical protein E2C00_02820 [Streptomyces sp. WAC05374]
MIIHSGTRAAVLLGTGGERTTIRCLARRGMLHSECEAVDEVRLDPGTRLDLTGRDGTEAAWYVLAGSVTAGGDPPPLTEGALVLARHGRDVRLTAGPHGADLLCLTLTPAAVTRTLPPRTPSVPQSPAPGARHPADPAPTGPAATHPEEYPS